MIRTSLAPAALLAALLLHLAGCGVSPRGDDDDVAPADDDSWQGDDDAADDDAADDDAADDDAADDDAADDDATPPLDDDATGDDDATPPPDDDATPPGSGLVVSPGEWAFGDVGIGCEAERDFEVRNTGDAPVEITAVQVIASPGDGSLALISSDLSPGDTLAAGADFGLGVRFGPMGEVPYTGRVRVTAEGDDGGLTAEADVSGDGHHGPVRSDHFVQEEATAADVLWVVDDSCSMSEEQATLAEGFSTYFDAVVAGGVDWHAAVITTTSGAFRSSSGVKVVTAETPDADAVFTALATPGVDGSGDEQGLEMAYQALQPAMLSGPHAGFLREGAVLHLVVLSDEPDFSPQPWDDYLDFFRTVVANPDQFVASVIGGVDESGPTSCVTAEGAVGYWELADATGGVLASICEADWDPALEAIAVVGGDFLLGVFPLSETPVEDTIEVEMDGLPASGWTFDPIRNAVVFGETDLPEVGASVDVTYATPAAC